MASDWEEFDSHFEAMHSGGELPVDWVRVLWCYTDDLGQVYRRVAQYGIIKQTDNPGRHLVGGRLPTRADWGWLILQLATTHL